MADNRTNVDIFSAIDEEQEEPVVSQDRITSITDFPNDNLNTSLMTESLPSEALETQIAQGDVDKQKFRSAMGGLTFQFWDEIEAFARSLAPGQETSYEQAKAEINKKVAEYAKAYPKEAFVMEVGGAALPTLLSVFGSPAAMVASFSNIFKIGRSVFKPGTQSSALSVGQRMNRAGIGAGVYSVGESENKGFMDFAGGYALGAPIAGGFVLGGNVLSGISNYVVTLAKTKFNESTSKKIRKEIQKLVDETGKSEDQIITDLMNGRLMSENQTLNNLIKETIKGRGGAQEVLDEIAKKRIGETKGEVINELQQLVSGTKSDKSLIRVWNQSQDKIQKKEKELYDTVFGKKGGNPNLVKGIDNGLVDDILKAAQMKKTGVFDELETVYSTSEHLVPLFTKNETTGVIRMLRQPTLEDVEVVRRTLAEVAYDFNLKGKGQSGGNIRLLEDKIRKKLDDMSPGLASVREIASQVRRAREAYEYGRGLLTGKDSNSPEIVEEYINMFGDVPGVMNALRIGIVQALKNKEGSSKIKGMADPDSNLYTIIRKVIKDVPEGSIDDAGNLTFRKPNTEIFNTIDVAANAAKVNPTLQGSFGSQTQDKAQAAVVAAQGSRDLAQEGGATNAVLNFAIRYMTGNRGLSNDEAMEYLKLITTRPEMYKELEKVFKENQMGTFAKLLDSMITGLAGTAGDLRAKTGSSDINTTLDPVGASGIEGLMNLAIDNAVPLLTGYPQEQ